MSPGQDAVALDTNVLVRFLVEDDERQTRAAAALINRAIEADERLYVSDVVLCELVWVLAGSYRVQREEIATTLRQLLRAKHLEFSVPDLLARVLDAFEGGQGDFSDYLIREHARGSGYDSVATFDKALLREPNFISP